MAFGPAQIIVIVALLVLLFGANRIASLGRGLGEGIRNFKRGLEDHEPQRLVKRSRDSAERRRISESRSRASSSADTA